jgi:hypothetical protein
MVIAYAVSAGQERTTTAGRIAEILQKYIFGGLTMAIEQAALKKGHYYKGIGRFAANADSPCVALWDGDVFRGLDYKHGYFVAAAAEYGQRGFTPVAEI